MSASVNKKKNKINMAYFKKAMEYVGAASIDYFEDSAPTISNTIDEARYTFGNIKSLLNRSGDNVSSYIKTLKNQRL